MSEIESQAGVENVAEPDAEFLFSSGQATGAGARGWQLDWGWASDKNWG